jgi:hypothetical protein
MDLVKQYIVQSISAASNNLRLSTQKIEVVALLREEISKSDNLEQDIKEMKKITELSKFAIRLHEIFNFLTQPYVDFLRVSDKFREHSQFLIKDLSSLLENVSPASFKKALEKLHPSVSDIIISGNEDIINLDLSRREAQQEFPENNSLSESGENLQGSINEEETFESEILRPVKPLDTFLKELNSAEPDKTKLEEFSGTMRKNSLLSEEQGFEILAGMHDIVSESLNLISAGKLIPDNKTVDSIRSCLIVIVAVVKDKKIDVTPFLDRAEEFGKQIKNIN